jgi:Domain of unknown function (DUF7025)
LRPLTAKETELLQELGENPVSTHEESATSDSDSDYSISSSEDEVMVEHPSIPGSTSGLPDGAHESKNGSPEEVKRLWDHAMQYRILCRIICTGSSGRDYDTLDHHFAEYYEDVPFKSRDSGVTSRHLSGHLPIANLKSYRSSSLREGASFLVLRGYQCKNPRQHAPRQRKTVFPRITVTTKVKGDYSEFILVTSKALEKAIRSVATCEPEDSFVPYEWKVGSLVFIPPYRFVYHHREKLLEYAKGCRPSIGNQISAFLAYIEGTWGIRYRQADELFRQGKTNRPSLQFLFCPGEIVVSTETPGTIIAYTLHSWPLTGSGIALDCWGWTYDGLMFRRKGATITVGGQRKPIDGVTSISALDCFPLRYAPLQLRNHLKDRGQKFWDLRFQHYISYTGWDVMKDENHVRYRILDPSFKSDGKLLSLISSRLRRDV